MNSDEPEACFTDGKKKIKTPTFISVLGFVLIHNTNCGIVVYK